MKAQKRHFTIYFSLFNFRQELKRLAFGGADTQDQQMKKSTSTIAKLKNTDR